MNVYGVLVVAGLSGNGPALTAAVAALQRKTAINQTLITDFIKLSTVLVSFGADPLMIQEL